MPSTPPSTESSSSPCDSSAGSAPATSTLLDKIERALADRLDAQPDPPPRLLAAARHAVLGGGKRLRPILCLRAALAVGGRIEDAVDVASAVEFVHAFSLVHDDLPALDDDDLRRGRPTVHKAFDEATAILAGDFLLAVAAQSAAASPVDAGRATRELLAATNEMIFGQLQDTLGGTDPSLPEADQLRAIHARKTGALIAVSCRLGALAGRADEPTVAALDRFGGVLGQMFQAVDDLLDETQTTEHLGKAAGKDREAGKLTYPRIHGIEGTRRLIESMRESSLAAISDLGRVADPLRDLVEDLAVRTR
ncbi:MAG: polyprenyl synthetase family protein [Phycisphaerales bacterium]|jgi:geranylgeranyl diphosphate synthase type II